MRIHLIGIGGIGVSALARHYLAQGDFVTGSDLTRSEITDGLKKAGARVFIGPHKTANLSCAKLSLAQPNLVIYSPAIEKNNPELKQAYKISSFAKASKDRQNTKVKSYPEALGELTKKYFTIAVCGTHGKGTTTAMIALILIKAGLDPTIIIGTKLKEFNDSNYRHGQSKYLLIEADEYKSSFLSYWPKAIVITTIDADHLDYFKNLGNIIKTFGKFVSQLPNDGILITNKNDENTQKVITKYQVPSTNKFSITNFQLIKSKDVEKLKQVLKLPGEHILADALAALTLARVLKIPDRISFKALSEYRGAWRRFEEKTMFHVSGFKFHVISDYAHHPTEIKVTLDAVRQKYSDNRIWCVFQPHQYQRTFYLFKDFIDVLAKAPIDKLILAPIYSVAGRESQTIKNKVNSQELARAIQNKYPPSSRFAGLRRAGKILNTKYKIQNTETIYIASIPKIAKYLRKNLQGNDILVIMGAGDIYNLLKLMEN